MARRPQLVTQLITAACAVLCACSHDLEALQSGGGKGGGAGSTPIDGGGGTSGTDHDGGGGNDQDGSTSGTGGDSGPADPLEACRPCTVGPDLEAALGMDVEACCTGASGRVCGLKIEDGNCLPRNVQGLEAAECVSEEVCVNGNCVMPAGCCRPDGHCGMDIMGLGCIAREEFPSSVGGPFPQVDCVHPCNNDDMCDGSNPEFICTESVGGADRFCAAACASDRHCPSLEVCGIANNDADNRVDAYCQDPIGPNLPNEMCNSAEDCVNGICISGEQYCSRLCETDNDCPTERPNCTPANIPKPDGNGTQTLRICLGD